jgi:hypothetical protein
MTEQSVQVFSIPLTRDGHTLIDAEDYEAVSRHSWYLHRTAGRKNYAASRVRGRVVLLHRFLVHAPAGLEVTHVNRDGLDNRRSNLRIATHSDTHHNIPAQEGCTSEYKGVCWHRGGRKWVAQIDFEGVHYYLGLYRSEEDAAIAFDAVARALHGQFAFLNFPGREVSPELQAGLPPAAQALLNRKEVLLP